MDPGVWGTLGIRAVPLGPISMQFLAIMLPNNRLVPPVWEILDPPLVGILSVESPVTHVENLILKQDCIPVGCVPPTC